jgi:hypothetical protein
MLVAPTIIGFLFAILCLISPCIFKFAFKMDSFFGFCQGICCSFLTGLVITVATIAGSIALAVVVTDSAQTGNAENIVETSGIGALLLLFFIAVVIYLSIFFLLLCYTRRVSDPQHPYNSIFMFISGYTIFSFTLVYVIIAIICLVAGKAADEVCANNSTFDKYGSAFMVEIEFIIFGEILRLAGMSILFMLHHRKLNSSLIWIGCGVYYGPLLFYLIGIIAKWSPLIEFPGFLFDLASIGLGCYFYYQYANQTASTTALAGDSPYEMQA